MGGKIAAYNKITRYAEQLAQSQHATGMQDIILGTDQAYWQVISLVNKKKLAESYLRLVQQLDSDIDKMIAEGVATKADGLSVKVKVNEAEMKLTQVEDGPTMLPLPLPIAKNCEASTWLPKYMHRKSMSPVPSSCPL